MNEYLKTLLEEYVTKAEKAVPAALQDYLQLVVLTDVVWLCISIVIVGCYGYFIRWMIKNNIDIVDSDMAVLCTIAGGVAAVLFTYIALTNLIEICMISSHPQGYLLKLFLQGIHK